MFTCKVINSEGTRHCVVTVCHNFFTRRKSLDSDDDDDADDDDDDDDDSQMMVIMPMDTWWWSEINDSNNLWGCYSEIKFVPLF